MDKFLELFAEDMKEFLKEEIIFHKVDRYEGKTHTDGTIMKMYEEISYCLDNANGEFYVIVDFWDECTIYVEPFGSTTQCIDEYEICYSDQDFNPKNIAELVNKTFEKYKNGPV